ncbi:MAG: mechanosensitive ion channel family protein [Actinomycetia bacterium]|nr:mechanosensitive ion channel family protein [Actinomycetes bacterium]
MEGEVEEVSARTVRLITVDGRRVHSPNRSVLDGAITNLTSEGRRLTTFIVGAAYDTDLDLARQVIVEALGTSPLVLSDPPPQAFVEEFADSTINIACRFWHPPQIQAEWAARDESMRAVKRALDDTGITIAFPQRVLWVQPTDG